MSVFVLTIREMRHRIVAFLLGALAVVAAVTLLVSLVTIGRGSNLETRQLMRDLGFNLLVLPEGSDPGEFWARDFVSGDMPQEYATKLAETPGISADHYVATLQRKVSLQDTEVLLTGVLREETAVDAGKKRPMGTVVAKGKCFVGFAAAEKMGLQEGDALDVLGKTLTVERCLLESGSKEDIRVYAHLSDVQAILGMEGRINLIQALGCLCRGELLPQIRKEISRVLPGTYVTEMENIVAARRDTRKLVEDYVGFIIGIAVVMSAAWVGLLSLLNVRERRQEVGLLRALGFGSWQVATLFICRAGLMGVLGAIAGFAVGTWLAMHYGPDMFKITVKNLKPAWDLAAPVLVGAPLVAALAGLLPAMVAVTQDPAEVLTEE